MSSINHTRIFWLNVGGSHEKRSIEMLRVNIREKRIFISSENLVLLFLEIFNPAIRSCLDVKISVHK